METKPTIQIVSILLIESYFKREVILDDQYNGSIGTIDVQTQKVEPIDNVFSVYLTITFKQQLNSTVFLECTTTMAGTFRRLPGVTEEFYQNFCNINAPAIIFPFIREIIASQTMKAGVQPVVIQPINFVELAKSDDKKVTIERPSR
ncbi:MAG: protein-export chaperone SecB [Bacteroidota bacterium]